MKKNKAWPSLLLAVAGAVSLCIGGFVLTNEDVKAISGWCIGFGAAALGLGIGEIIELLIVSRTKSEDFTRRKKIEENDERNIRLREKVGAKINQVIVYALSVILLAFGFMGDITAVIIVTSVLLLELVLAVTLSVYYSKRM